MMKIKPKTRRDLRIRMGTRRRQRRLHQMCRSTNPLKIEDETSRDRRTLRCLTQMGEYRRSIKREKKHKNNDTIAPVRGDLFGVEQRIPKPEKRKL